MFYLKSCTWDEDLAHKGTGSSLVTMESLQILISNHCDDKEVFYALFMIIYDRVLNDQF